MNFKDCLYSLTLKPLQLLFEVIFNYAYSFISNPGLCIIALSFAINILVLPLYNRADKVQDDQRKIEAKLEKGIAHIRKTFKGDECTMMLSTYYRQNNYSPLMALRGAISLLLEVPFFIAAYSFLSTQDVFNGCSFGPITDLSKPDGLIQIAGLSINLLPIIMTLVNVASCFIFTKGYPVKTKVQLYLMAAFFLVFLYSSPSCLTFYWTLNNTFSLVKAIINKMKNPMLIIRYVLFAVGLSVVGVTVYKFSSLPRKWALVFAAVGIILCVPLALNLIFKKKKPIIKIDLSFADSKVFALSVILLAVLTGALIPSAVISSSTQEFVNAKYFIHPIWYVVCSLFVAMGTFILWPSVFYYLASKKGRAIINVLICAMCFLSLVNYLFFGTNLVTISSSLEFIGGISFTSKQQLLNLLVLLLVGLLAIWLYLKKRNLIKNVLLVGIAAACIMSTLNITKINSSISQMNLGEVSDSQKSIYTLSKTGKNVVVIVLDRAMGTYVPYLFNENPELAEAYDGFTYYSNTVSYGAHTNFAMPALYGGYEYTPVELNKRKDETLESKHNEALKVMPTIFSEEGYDVVVCDPPYAGYQWTPDLSIYDDIENVEAYNTNGLYSTADQVAIIANNRFRNFFCYSIMKTSPLIIQSSLYNLGYYRQLNNNSIQQRTSSSTAKGTDLSFYGVYSVLENMENATKIENKSNGSFILFQNETTHNAILFQEPDYELSETVNNEEYDSLNNNRFVVDGVTMNMETAEDYGAYETNMAALMRIGEWLDYLKTAGVYDNTRIIIVSDHGYACNQFDELIIDDSGYSGGINTRYGDVESYIPLLMVKDFSSTGFTESTEFMTIADVVTLATEGVVENPVNPYTGNEISNDEKNEHEQYIIASNEYVIDDNNGNQFKEARWYSVSENVWDKSNWKLVAEDTILE